MQHVMYRDEQICIRSKMEKTDKICKTSEIPARVEKAQPGVNRASSCAANCTNPHECQKKPVSRRKNSAVSVGTANGERSCIARCTAVSGTAASSTAICLVDRTNTMLHS